MFLGFLGSSDGKESTCNTGDLGSIPGLGRPPGGGHGNPLQYSCLENPHEQRSLAGCSPWGFKELDMAEHLSTATQISGKIAVINKCYLLFVRKINAEELLEKPLIFLCYIE